MTLPHISVATTFTFVDGTEANRTVQHAVDTTVIREQAEHILRLIAPRLRSTALDIAYTTAIRRFTIEWHPEQFLVCTEEQTGPHVAVVTSVFERNRLTSLGVLKPDRTRVPLRAIVRWDVTIVRHPKPPP